MCSFVFTMYDSKLLSNPGQAYVFDESGKSPQRVDQHPQLRFTGPVVETLRFPIDSLYTGAGLTNVLLDCSTDWVGGVTRDGKLRDALTYLRSVMSIKRMKGSQNEFSVHRIDIN